MTARMMTMMIMTSRDAILCKNEKLDTVAISAFCFACCDGRAFFHYI